MRGSFWKKSRHPRARVSSWWSFLGGQAKLSFMNHSFQFSRSQWYSTSNKLVYYLMPLVVHRCIEPRYVCMYVCIYLYSTKIGHYSPFSSFYNSVISTSLMPFLCLYPETPRNGWSQFGISLLVVISPSRISRVLTFEWIVKGFEAHVHKHHVVISVMILIHVMLTL